MGIGIEGQNLIFLISQPRAGSTMTQRILGSHPDIHTSSEPWIMLHPIYGILDSGYEAEYNAAWARHITNNFYNTLSNKKEAYFEGLRKMSVHLYDCALSPSGKHFFLDKTPRYYHIIPQLYHTFPKAKFIILLRNPLAVFNSVVTTWTKDDLHQLEDFKHDLITAPRKLLDGIDILGHACQVLQYENVLKNTEYEIKKVCTGLGLNFFPDMINYGSSQLPKWSEGDQKLVYQKTRPDPHNLDKWTVSFKNPQIWQAANDYLEFLGHEIICQMGYSYRELRKTLDANRPQELDVTQISQVEWLQKKPDQYEEVPKTSLGYTIIAKKNEREGKLVESATAYRKAIKLNSKSAWSYHSLGKVLAKLQRWDEVIASYQKAIKLNPNSASFYYDLAQAFIQQGNLDEAIANYSKAIEIKPSFSMGYNSLGESLAKKGKLAEAASFFLQAIELNSGSYKARGNLAEVLAEEGHLNEAFGFYEEAVKINPSYRTENLKLQEAVKFFCNHHDDKSVGSMENHGQ
jgi:tetratricopeptide (TPR) repeat protein